MMISQERKIFEEKYGRISDSAWSKYRREMTLLGLEINSENVIKYKELKNSLACNLASTHYTKAQKIYIEKKKELLPLMEGQTFLDFLHAQLQIRPHRSTVSRWFSELGGYRKDRQYSKSQLSTILLNATFYKVKFYESLN